MSWLKKILESRYAPGRGGNLVGLDGLRPKFELDYVPIMYISHISKGLGHYTNRGKRVSAHAPRVNLTSGYSAFLDAIESAVVFEDKSVLFSSAREVLFRLLETNPDMFLNRKTLNFGYYSSRNDYYGFIRYGTDASVKGYFPSDDFLNTRGTIFILRQREAIPVLSVAIHRDYIPIYILQTLLGMDNIIPDYAIRVYLDATFMKAKTTHNSGLRRAIKKQILIDPVAHAVSERVPNLADALFSGPQVPKFKTLDEMQNFKVQLIRDSIEVSAETVPYIIVDDYEEVSD